MSISSSNHGKFSIICSYFQQRQVPTFAYEKRLSRIETLRLAITYIGFMTEILAGTPPNEPNRPNELTAYPPSTSHPHHHHHHLPIQREFIPPYNHQWINYRKSNINIIIMRSVEKRKKKAKWFLWVGFLADLCKNRSMSRRNEKHATIEEKKIKSMWKEWKCLVWKFKCMPKQSENTQ